MAKTNYADTQSKSNGGSKYLIFFGMVICLAAGFFAGREYSRHEMKCASKKAVSSPQDNIAASAPAPAAAEKARENRPAPFVYKKIMLTVKNRPLSVELLSKNFHLANLTGGDSGSSIDYNLKFRNLTKRDIRSFRGKLIIRDLFDNKLLETSLHVEEPLAADASLERAGSIAYKQTSDAHIKLSTVSSRDLKVGFAGMKIIYSDNTGEEYQE